MADKKDMMIIDALRKNSREPVRDIAKKTGLRPSTAHQRIRKLSASGLIEKFTIKTDNFQAGEAFIVFMLIKTSKDVDNRVFLDRHVKEVFGITGEYDLLLKLKFKDVSEFNSFIIKFRKDQNIRDTMSMVATATIKEEM